MLKKVMQITFRECGISLCNPIYESCMVIFPIPIIIFFTSLINEGQPVKIPADVVDLNNTTTSRRSIHNLDSYQMSHVVAHYFDMNDARQATQRNEIYAFLLIPKGMTSDLTGVRQPKVSFYYSSVSLAAGSALYRDLKTITTLGSTGVASAKLTVMGRTNDEVKTFLQPIAIDLHVINNPLANYNVYLSATMTPDVLPIFILLVSAYSIGTELKFKGSKKWLVMADNNVCVAMAGKILSQTIIFLTIPYAFGIYIYYMLGSPRPGGLFPILLLGLLTVLVGQDFGVFALSLVPSLRMSMSVCSLQAVLGFTTSGAMYPVSSMSPMIKAMAQLFPLRHYYMTYRQCIFNGFPLTDAWFDLLALCTLIILPIFTPRNTKRAMLTYVYIP